MSKPTIWQRVSVNVPDWYTRDQVADAFDKAGRTGSEYYERQGFAILEATSPMRSPQIEQDLYCSPDATRYTIWLRMGRAPVLQHYDVPDYAALEVQEKTGLILAE